MEKLSIQEEEAMQAVWQTGEGNVKLFLENMPDPRPPYTTLASTIKNLEKKGFLRSQKIGNTFVYQALVKEEMYKKKHMHSFVKDYFDNSYKNMVSFFVKDNKISVKELQEILKQIEEEK